MKATWPTSGGDDVILDPTADLLTARLREARAYSQSARRAVRATRQALRNAPPTTSLTVLADLRARYTAAVIADTEAREQLHQARAEVHAFWRHRVRPETAFVPRPLRR
jgi:hypothetical protein